MSAEPEPAEVAAALQVSIGLFMRRLRRAPVRGELTMPEMSALTRLDRAGSATASALARAEQITPQAMGATVAELTRRGLAQGRPDPADGRRTVLSLTEAGQRLVRTKRSTRTQQLAKALADGFTPEELQTLFAAASLIERLGESVGSPGVGGVLRPRNQRPSTSPPNGLVAPPYRPKAWGRQPCSLPIRYSNQPPVLRRIFG